MGGGSSSTTGIGVEGIAGSYTGVNYAIRGVTNSPDGFSGHFSGGKFYVNGNVGIGTLSPTYPLHVSTHRSRAGYFTSDSLSTSTHST